jgi:regulator of sirC expression with transglutaminase-like and TPR domain
MSRHPTEIPPPCRSAFARLVSQPEPMIDLAEAALLLASEEYPGLEVGRYLSRLDRMASEVQARVGLVEDPHRVIAALNAYLFQEQGFHGNTEDYYDPRNSFLNEVLDRRTGIPITLSAVYIEVGRRVGCRLQGVGMPGHFLVKYVSPDEEIVLDPFHDGAILSAADCQRILDRVYEGKVAFDPRFLATVGTRQILARMLSNLKAIYFHRHAYAKALSVVERLLILDPRAAIEIRDRGLLFCQLRQYATALTDLDQYLKLVPEAEDAEVIRDHLRSIRQRVASLN